MCPNLVEKQQGPGFCSFTNPDGYKLADLEPVQQTGVRCKLRFSTGCNVMRDRQSVLMLKLLRDKNGERELSKDASSLARHELSR